MSFDPETLYRLLPAIYRIRDAEIAAGLPDLLTADEVSELKGLETTPNPTQVQHIRIKELRDKAAQGPLKALFSALIEQVGVMGENLDQLYDDLFIETCADWVIPYIGDLIGYQPLHPLGKLRGFERAEVAHTISLRRRKGTAAVLEQLARDVTQWDARAVEFFQVLATTQYMNHLRPNNYYSPDVRHWEPLSRIGTAFDSIAHTVDVRRIERRSGKYNIPNIGIFLWRLDAYSHTQSTALRLDDRRWFISPLGHPLQLFHRPRAETEITHIAEPINVAEPISRRMLHEHKSSYYGSTENPSTDTQLDNAKPSIVLYIDDAEVPRAKIVACDLSDDGVHWSHKPKSGCYAIDPVLGRIACAADLPIPQDVKVTYHRGFSADIGGGEYSRKLFDTNSTPVKVPDTYPTIQAALDALNGEGLILITNNGRYEEALKIGVASGKTIILRAAEEKFPTIVLPVNGNLSISGGVDSEFVLEGMLLTTKREPLPSSSTPLRLIHVPANSGPVKLTILHSTLVPGRALDVAGEPLFPEKPAIHIEAADITITIESSIVGALHLHSMTQLSAIDCIIDATAHDRMAVTGLTGKGAGGVLTLQACTVIGKVYVHEVGEISNCVLFSRQAGEDSDVAIKVERRQVGCVRFTYLPLDSQVPTRYQCQPDARTDPTVAPNFVNQRFGVASYCQLAISTSDLIRSGADDESEMGAFHHQFPAQREANLRVRLKEFLRVGLEAGIFYET
jgi:hypothetical protein